MFVNVLDLDLDFFLNGVAYFKDDDGKRLDSKFYKPWTQSQVRSFLEQKCGLSVTAPVKGRIVEHHDDAFDFWQYLTNRHFVLPCHSNSKSVLLWSRYRLNE